MRKQVLNYTVIVKPDQRTGTDEACFSVFCPAVDVYSEGDTVEEALANVKEAIELKLEVLAEKREDLPMEDEELLVAWADTFSLPTVMAERQQWRCIINH